MSPGRALDALVAAKVMGCEVVASSSKRGAVFYTEGEPHWVDDAGCMELSNPVPAYSTDIAAAWEVVGRMAEQGFLYAMAPGVCSFRLIEDAPWYRGEGSAPHAICLAALKAIGYTPSQ